MKGMKLLGFKAEDKVTGREGTITSMSYDLYGCIQALMVWPNKTDDNCSQWFDIKRLIIKSKSPVMEVPDFELPEIGAENKPLQ